MKEVKDLLEEIMPKENIELLDTMGFFIMPASSNKHLSVKEGLAQHSLNVCNFALDLNDNMDLGLNRKDILMATLLHDVDKISYYEENILQNGEQSKSKPYLYKPKIVMPHGCGAIYLLCNELKLNLPVQVAVAISHHMGAFNDDFRSGVNQLTNHPVDMLLTWLLQTADTFSTWITEKKFTE